MSTTRHLVRDIPVLVENTRPDIATAQVLDRLGQALDLVARHAPARFRRLRHDFALILVQRFPCRAAYLPDQDAALIELTFLAHPDITPAQVAASIVHEAVHARVHRMGIRRVEGGQAKEERLCRRAELELGLAIPGAEAVVARARDAMALADQDVAPAIDWGIAGARVREIDERSGTNFEPD
jgi:hypothetical protein